jgi:hypothetical protein
MDKDAEIERLLKALTEIERLLKALTETEDLFWATGPEYVALEKAIHIAHRALHPLDEKSP